jgi:hypothetical protein
MRGADALVEAAVAKFGPQSVEDLIQRETTREAFRADRKTTFVCGPGFAGHIHQAGEKVIHLPGGGSVKVTTDESGKATHVEEDECQHAIVRPDTYRTRTRQ